MVGKVQRSIQQESADLPPSPFLMDSLVRRAKERRLSEASEKERERRLSSLNPRERRASLDHETRLIRERERKSIVEALERRRVSLVTEPLDNKRQLKKLRRKSRRRSSNGSGKRRRSIYRKRGRRSIARDIQPRRLPDDHEGRRRGSDEKKRKSSDDDREPRKSLGDEQIRNNSIAIPNKLPISPVKLKNDSLDDIGTTDEYSSSLSGSGDSGSSSTPSRNNAFRSGLLAVKSPPVAKTKDQNSSNQRNEAAVASPPHRLPVHVPGALTKLSIAPRPRLRSRDITEYTKRKSIHDRFAPSLVHQYDMELELAKERKKQEAEDKRIETERFLKARLMKRRGNPSALTAVIPQMISPGLKILNAIENFFMQHKAFKKEGCNAGVINMYQFVNGDGRNIIRVEEQSKIRGFLGLGQIIKYTCYDEENSEVGQIYRNDIAGCGKVKKRVKVYCPSNHLIGYVEQKRGCIEPQVDVTDHEGFVYAVIRLDTSEFGPIRAWMCRRHKIFSIKTLRGAARGQIREDWDEQPFTPIGVHLSDEMNIVAKTLLMTATIIVYDQFCKKRTESLQKDPQQIVEISDKDDDEDDEDEN